MIMAAICQTDILWEDKSRNMQRAEDLIRAAARETADLALFPEMSFTGFSMNVDRIAEKSGETLGAVSRMAKEHGIGVGFGWVKARGDGLAENHYTMIDKSGAVASDYVKIHSFAYGGEREAFKKGGAVSSCMAGDMRMSAFICYDLRFPEIFQAVSNDVSVIVVAANWPAAREDHWSCLLKARAIENQCYVVGVNCAGRQKETVYPGKSCLINPAGRVLVELSDKEGMAVCGIEDDVAAFREVFQMKRDRRPELYKELRLEI